MLRKWWRVWFILRFAAILAIAPLNVQADMVPPASGRIPTFKGAVRSEPHSMQSSPADTQSRTGPDTRLQDATGPNASRNARENALVRAFMHKLKDGLAQAAFVLQTILSEINSMPAGSTPSDGGEILPGLRARDSHAITRPDQSERRMENNGEVKASLFGLRSMFGR